MRRAYSYKRFSSPKQARGDSLRRQTEFEQQIVKEMGLVLDDSLDLTDRGVSGFRGDNRQFGALAEFLKLVEGGRIPRGSVLLVENLDRLSREQVDDAYDLFRGLIKAGITIVTASPREIYNLETTKNDISKVMLPVIYMMRAHDESAQKSTRLQAAWSKRRKRALENGEPLTGRCPAWLRVKNGKYEVIEDHAETIRLIYRWMAEGLGLHRVTQRLVEQKRAAFGRSGAWHETYVRKLMTWRAVHGEFQPHVSVDGVKAVHGDPVPDYYPAVITRDQFEVAQATMSGRRRKLGRPPAEGRDENLFTGIAYLADDGSKMCLLNSGRSKGKSAVYLGSSHVRRGRKGASLGRTIAYPFFEKTVLAAVSELKPSDFEEPDDDPDGMAQRKLKAEGRVMTLDHRYKEFEAQLYDPDCTTPAAELKAVLANLSEARRKATEEYNTLQVESGNCRGESVGEAKSLIQMLDQLPPGPERGKIRGMLKTRLRWLVNEIWVRIESQNRKDFVLHVQIFLRSGKSLYRVAMHPTPPDTARPPRLHAGVDFRTHFRAEE